MFVNKSQSVGNKQNVHERVFNFFTQKSQTLLLPPSLYAITPFFRSTAVPQSGSSNPQTNQEIWQNVVNGAAAQTEIKCDLF